MGCGDVRLLRTIGGVDVTRQERATLNKLTMPLTGIAVEIQAPNGVGRCRMLPLADASAASLHPFVTDHVEPRATVITDGWAGYSGLEKLGYVHDRRSQRAGPEPAARIPARCCRRCIGWSR